MKCSGELPSCDRCRLERIACCYSPRKKMGRPRKRRRDDDYEAAAPPAASDYYPQSSAADEHHGQQFQPHHQHHGSGSGFGVAHAYDPSHLPVTLPYDGGLDPAYQQAPSYAMDPSLYGPSTPGMGAGYAGYGYVDAVSQQPASLPIDPASLFNDPTLDPLDYGYLNQNVSPVQPANSTSDNGPQIGCICLSSIYLAITDLSALKDFAFPICLPQVRNALTVASVALKCPECPKTRATAVTNFMQLTTLLQLIAERYDRVLRAINDESDRAEEARETKHFRVGEHQTRRAHLHTGTADCPMGFNVELDPGEWRTLARKAVRQDVLGPAAVAAVPAAAEDDGDDTNPDPDPDNTDDNTNNNELTTLRTNTSLNGIVDLLIERQKSWHLDPKHEGYRQEYRRQRKLSGLNPDCDGGGGGEEFTCLKLIKVVKEHIQCLNL